MMILTEPQIQAKIESAGRTILMLPGKANPQGYGQSWPEHIREYLDTLDYSEEHGLKVIEVAHTLRWPTATNRQIDELDEILGWILNLKQHCDDARIPWVYGALRVAMLHHPISAKRFYSWRKIGKHFGRSHETVRGWYDDGIRIIARMKNSY